MQKDSGLAELDSVIIKESAFEIEPRLVVLCYLFPRIKNNTPRLSCAKAYYVDIRSRFEKCPEEIIRNITVL